MPANITAETDLYQPVHDYLVAQGYTVRSEVRDCDIAAVKDDALVIIELKRTLSLALLAQAIKRQELTEAVYIAIPRPPNRQKWNAQTRDVRRLLRRLELGLLLVSKRSVEIVFHPLPAERQQRKGKRRVVLEEIENRSGDYNQGGSTRKKLVTAYRENAIQIAACLSALGPCSPAQLRKLGTGEKSLGILYRNVYGWFERQDRGLYALSVRGQSELAGYPELAARYRPDGCAVSPTSD
ncbi:MAG: DUF2161 family putative PD-(D/E)XK-type phosphodiesterase [Armatimonadota bacterium]